MKKLLLLLAGCASVASASIGWTPSLHIKQIWVVPGPNPVVHLQMYEATEQYYCFYLNPPGNDKLLKLAEDAFAGNWNVTLYADRNESSTHFYTGMSSPDVSDVMGNPLFTLAINR